MQDRINRQVSLTSRPAGIPKAEHFEIIEVPIPNLENGQVLVRNNYFSVEPAMRGWVSAAANYFEAVALGVVMRAFSGGRIKESRYPEFRVGKYVTGMFGWQDYAAIDAKEIQRKITDTNLPLSTSLCVLGLNGLTAYFGLLEAGQPKSGETVMVSTAAGSVGSCVGEIAKRKGCRTIGIAGGPQKVRFCLDEFRYDEAIDYKVGILTTALAAACPDDVDIYFDNSTRAISDTVLKQLKVGARVVICGTASIASWEPIPLGPRVERYLLVKRARMQGSLILDYAPRYPQGLQALSQWLRAGLIRYREDILEGMEQVPGSIAGLYRGKKLGKRLNRIAPEGT